MTSRRKLLDRLERLRAVERQEALARLAEKRAEQARMEDVARRTRALVGEGELTGGVRDGAALAGMLAFHARLATLVKDADRLGVRAAAAEALARASFAEADQRLERVRTRRAGIERKAEEIRMARGLLSSGHKPRGPL